jgi:hypothetical protein
MRRAAFATGVLDATCMLLWWLRFVSATPSPCTSSSSTSSIDAARVDAAGNAVSDRRKTALVLMPRSCMLRCSTDAAAITM